MSYTLSIVTYNRGKDDAGVYLPFRWTYHVNTRRSHTSFYQVYGGPGTFYYQGEEKGILGGSDNRTGMMDVGSVPEDRLDELEGYLAEFLSS